MNNIKKLLLIASLIGTVALSSLPIVSQACGSCGFHGHYRPVGWAKYYNRCHTCCVSYGCYSYDGCCYHQYLTNMGPYYGHCNGCNAWNNWWW